MDIHGYIDGYLWIIHIHRRLTCVHAAPIFFCKIQQCKSVYPPRKTWHRYSPL